MSTASKLLRNSTYRSGIRRICWQNQTCRLYSTKFADSDGSNEKPISKKCPKLQPIDENIAKNSPTLVALHSRLNLGEKFAYSTLARALITNTAQVGYINNEGMSRVGKNILSFYLYEHFMVKYPRLPPNVLRHVVDLHTSISALANTGKSWGVESDVSSPFTRYIADRKDSDLLGRLLYKERETETEDGIVEVSSGSTSTDINHAMGTFVRALIAGIYAHGGLSEARSFIYNHIIEPVNLDIAAIMAFDQPTRELAVLCSREGLERPISRLMAETGRYSKAPVFVVGVFSGDRKLGEGYGASLKEARTRAAVSALKSWYLYSPLEYSFPSDTNTENFKAVEYVDSGTVIV